MTLGRGEPTVFGAVLRAAVEPREVVNAEIDEELERMLGDQ